MKSQVILYGGCIASLWVVLKDIEGYKKSKNSTMRACVHQFICEAWVKVIWRRKLRFANKKEWQTEEKSLFNKLTRKMRDYPFFFSFTPISFFHNFESEGDKKQFQNLWKLTALLSITDKRHSRKKIVIFSN